MNQIASTAPERAALLVAHPGHELRVHGWLGSVRPLCFVLTKGDGQAGVSRLPSTTRVLEEAGAVPGSIYGRLDDAEIYAALLRRDVGLFVSVLDELVAALSSRDIRVVVADAEEGYNPSHDVCTYLAVAAAAMVGRITGQTVRVFDFSLIGAPNACPKDLRHESIWLNLDDEALACKLRSANNYPEMALEVSRAVQAHGADAFRVECLRPTTCRSAPAAVPFYERYGDQQVAAGRYREVIRYEQHIVPLRDALWAHAAVVP